MKFRFSLKWLLIVMLYAAVAAAAFSHGHWAYGDILWTASFVAFGYALLLVCIARGPRQIGALGFVIFFSCFLACLLFAPDGLPTGRLLGAFGVSPEQGAMMPPAPYAPPATWQLRPFNSIPATGSVQVQGGTLMVGSGMATITATPANPAVVGRSTLSSFDFPLKLRSTNAVGSMAAGIVGCLLAAVASARLNRAPREASL